MATTEHVRRRRQRAWWNASIVLPVVLGLLGSFVVGFGTKTGCTTDPANSCGHIDTAIWLHLAVQAALWVSVGVASWRGWDNPALPRAIAAASVAAVLVTVLVTTSY